MLYLSNDKSLRYLTVSISRSKISDIWQILKTNNTGVIKAYCHCLVLILILIKTRIDIIFGKKPPTHHHQKLNLA